jgi:excisionase family DNA binding protein
MAPCFTISAAAERLSVSTKTVRRMIARGELPAYRVGVKSIRLDSVDVERLLRPIPTVGGGDAA